MQGRAEVNFLLSRPISRRKLLFWRLVNLSITWAAILGALAILDRSLIRAASSPVWEGTRLFDTASTIAATGLMESTQLVTLLVVALFGLVAGQIRLTFRDLPWWKHLLKPSFYLVSYPFFGALLLVPAFIVLGSLLPAVRMAATEYSDTHAGVLVGLLCLWFLFNLWYCDREWKFWDIKS
jgi:hypothetical protein